MISFLKFLPRRRTLTPAQERDLHQLVSRGREVEAVSYLRRWTNTTLVGAVGIIADIRLAQQTPQPDAAD